MSYIGDKDFLIEVEKGNVVGHSLIHKFGRNENVGAAYEPLTFGGVYQTPQPASATTLRVAAGNANDTAAGSGAREVSFQGLDETGALVTEAVATAGASASSATSATFIRLFRAWVSSSGTYGTVSAGSHAADIVIENGAGGTTWATIDVTGFPKSQSEIAAYTIPLGKTGYLISYIATTDSNKAVDIFFFKREAILDAAAPYEAMRLQFEEVGIQGHIAETFAGAIKFTELTDIGFLVKAASPAHVSANFELLLVDN